MSEFVLQRFSTETHLIYFKYEIFNSILKHERNEI